MNNFITGVSYKLSFKEYCNIVARMQYGKYWRYICSPKHYADFISSKSNKLFVVDGISEKPTIDLYRRINSTLSVLYNIDIKQNSSIAPVEYIVINS